MTSIKVTPINMNQDWDAVFDSLWTAWSHPLQAIGQLVFPYLGGGGSAQERESFEKCKTRWRTAILNDPDHIIAKAVDEATGEVVGGLLGTLHKPKALGVEEQPDVQTTGWPAGTEERMLADETFAEIHRIRGLLATGTYGAGDWLWSLPRYRKSGVAEALIRWGVGQMDELNLESCAEATPLSRSILARFGYVPVQPLDAQLGRRGVARLSERGRRMREALERERLLVMWRPRQGGGGCLSKGGGGGGRGSKL